MRALTVREKWLLGLCFGVIFAVGNGFADNEMWLDDAPKGEARENWLVANMPKMTGNTLGKLQGDLIQSLQDELFNRKLRIDQQSLQEIVNETFYTEVAVRLEVEGAETAVIDWLTTLQGPNQFQIIKSLELELDNRSRDQEPQAECEITIARWYHPETGESIPATEAEGNSTTGT